MLSTPRDGGEKPQLKISTIVKGMAETKLKEAKIEPGSTKMAEKQMPGTVGDSLGKLITNCYQIEMKMAIYHFYIDVEAITNLPNARPVLLTPNAVTRSDYRLVDRRYTCNGVFKAFKQRMGEERDGQLVGIPMELCQVLDDQRVKGRHQAQNQIQHMIRHCAIPPSKMIKHNSNIVKPLTKHAHQCMKMAWLGED